MAANRGVLMEWIKRLLNRLEQPEQLSSQSRTLVQEIWEAHRDWKVAELKLNEAVEPDQIDYAIYVTEATEKRYNMLLREAKVQQLDMSEYSYQLPASRKNKIDM